MDTDKLKDRVIRKLKALMTGMPHSLDPGQKIEVKKLQFQAAKTLIAYLQKNELQNADDLNDEYDLPKTTRGLVAHLKGLSDKLEEHTDDEG